MLNSWARSNWFNFTAIRLSRKFRNYRKMPVSMQVKQVSSTDFPTHTFNDFFSEILLSTAHKAKGLEFPIVILADDFLPRSNETPLDELSVDENRENLNILYVAATRATRELVMNNDLFYLLYKMCRVRTTND